MFSGLFHYDNPVWRFIGKFFDIMILNILWFLCSIPIVTMGASTTAVYYVTLKLVRDEEGSSVKAFFKSFKENFRQATIIWLILLAAGAILGFDLAFFLRNQDMSSTFRSVMLAIFLAFSVVYLGIALFVFPLQCRFYNTVKRTLFNAFFISLRHFFHTLGIWVIDIGLIALAIYVLPLLLPMFFLFGFPLLAFINSFVLVGILDKYMPAKAEPDEAESRQEDRWEMPED